MSRTEHTNHTRHGEPGRRPARHRLAQGDVVPPRELTTIWAEPTRVPAPDRLTHLQFRRFAGCPLCNVHLRSVADRYAEIHAAGIREVVVFHSPTEQMLPHQGRLPFAVVADPHRELYEEFGVETSGTANLHPRAWSAPLRLRTWAVVIDGLRAGAKPGPQGETMLGLPADFLIDTEGRVRDVHYGRHAADQWSVDELLERASG